MMPQIELVILSIRQMGRSVSAEPQDRMALSSSVSECQLRRMQTQQEA